MSDTTLPQPLGPPPPGSGGSIPETIGPYTVLRPLKSGGQGHVFVCLDTAFPGTRRVVVKCLPQWYATDPDRFERFQREIALSGRINHQNVVTVYAAGDANGIPFYVMEFVDDSADLAEIVRRWRRLTEPQAVEAVAQAASGLEAIHNAGCIHRDVKPANLLLNRSGVVKHLDLGLAKCLTESAELTRPGQGFGTQHYVAPEQAGDARTAGIPADIYSLGCTFHYLLVGCPPTSDTSEVPLLQKSVSHALAKIVGKMIHPDSGKRYQSAKAVLDALRPHRKTNLAELLNLQPVVATPPDLWSVSWITDKLGKLLQFRWDR